MNAPAPPPPWLPAQPQTAPPPAPPPVRAEEQGQARAPPPVRPARVMLIDDSEVDALLLAQSLDAAYGGVETLWVEQAEEVWPQLLQWRPDAVVSDFHMPRYDVLDMLRKVRAHDPLLPFVVVSGLVGEELAVALVKAGASDFVPKSRIERLAGVLEREFAEACTQRTNARLAAALEAERHELRRARARMRELSLRLIDSQEAERRRVALDLHDGLGQLITLLKMQLSVAAPAATKEGTALAPALRTADQAVARLRAICLGLRPPELDDFGLEPALRELAAQSSALPGKPAVDMQVRGDAAALAPRLQTALYRVAQEALHNALRHSGAACVHVSLECPAAGSATLVVADDGCGFDPARLPRQAGIGLAGMRERLELLEGRFELITAPGRGTTVRATLDVLSAQGAA